VNLSLPPIHLETMVVVLLFALCYTTYHFDLLAPLFIRPFIGKVSGDRRQAYTLFLHRFSGVFLLGLIPLTFLFLLFDREPGEYGLRLPMEPLWFLVGLAACLLAFLILFTWTRKPALAETFPYARLSEWRRSDRTWNALSWITYLAAYESCLRGYLLFSLMRSIGAWPAILAMTAIYVIIHLDKQRDEVIGSALLGLLFGAITLASGSILVPCLIHMFIAVGTDILAIRFHHRVIRIPNREAGS